jgi:hypothetical protein
MSNDELPPPYTETSTAAPAEQPLSPGLLSSHLGAHLSSLPTRIRESQAARSNAQAAGDLDIITRVVPEIESFLSDITTHDHLPGEAELIIVPATSVPTKWQLTGLEERRKEGEIVQLVRVEGPPPDTKGQDSKLNAPAPPQERDYSTPQFDGWGRWDEPSSSNAPVPGSWWWRDETMAHRLASQLSPKAAEVAPRGIERQQVRAVVQETRRGWGWGRKKAPEPPAPASEPVARRPLTDDERVSMTVRAEEVTFRMENDFGIWESLTGWGLVARVRIRRG